MCRKEMGNGTLAIKSAVCLPQPCCCRIYPQMEVAANVGLVLDNQNKLSGSLAAFAHDLAAIEKPSPVTERSAGLFGRLTGKR